jgi:UDP-N-acetylglucosamine 2-epimerase (non-hydrolysing)
MIDSLFFALPDAKRTRFRETRGLPRGEAVIVTLHRPSNVDDPDRLRAIGSALRAIAAARPVVFPAHPRTTERLAAARVDLGAVCVVEPLRYLEMLDLVEGAGAVVTDSGGIQEETTALGVPCFTVRENTERPITLTEGTNRLVPDPSALCDAVLSGARPDAGPRPRPEGWDGHASERIVRAFLDYAPDRRAPLAPAASVG